MNDERIVECSFFVPTVRDANLSDGKPHEAATWEKLYEAMYVRFGGRTVAPGLYSGVYRDPDTGTPVADESQKMIVAMEESRLDELRQLLVEVCDWFQQKCIHLSVAGSVEFVANP